MGKEKEKGGLSKWDTGWTNKVNFVIFFEILVGYCGTSEDAPHLF